MSLPPTARMLIGVPNPELASSGTIHGQLPEWKLGSTLLLSTLLTPHNATSIYAAGPDFNMMYLLHQFLHTKVAGMLLLPQL